MCCGGSQVPQDTKRVAVLAMPCVVGSEHGRLQVELDGSSASHSFLLPSTHTRTRTHPRLVIGRDTWRYRNRAAAALIETAPG